MITGTTFEPGLAPHMAQHGVPIMFGKVHVQHDQVGLPDGAHEPAVPRCSRRPAGDGLLSVGGHHHIARQLATAQCFAEQQNISGIVFRQQDFKHVLVT